MSHLRPLCCGLIGLLFMTHAGCTGSWDPGTSSRGSRAASAEVTDAELAEFNKAIAAPADELMKFDGKDAFAEAVMKSFGPDKTSLDEARKIREQALDLMNSSIEKLRQAPAPYVPEAWAMKQACLSFLVAIRDVSTVYFDEVIDLALDDSFSVEEKTALGSRAFLRQKKTGDSILKLIDETGSAWDAWMKKRLSSN